MRYLLAAILLAISVSVPLAAQQSPVRVAVFVAEPEHGFGGSLEFRVAPTWAAEVSAWSASHRLTIGNILAGHVIEFRTRTIDITAHHYFVNTTRWQPYAGGGVHHMASSSDEVENRTSAVVDGGVHFMVTPSFSVRIDAKGLLNSSKSYDFGLTSSLGLAWRF